MNNMNLNTYKWIAMWVSIFMLAIAIQPTQASTIKAPSDSFWDTNMRLCDIDANGKCHYKDYALDILRFGIAGIVLAALSLLFFILFVPIRFLCGGFGGKYPSRGICPSLSDKRQYTKKEILSVKIVAILVVIPIVVAVGLGFESNSDISNSVDDVTTAIMNSGDKIVNTLVTVRGILLSFISDPSATRIIDDAIDAASNISAKVHNVHDDVGKYDTIRESVMVAGAICCVVMVIAGIVCAIFNIRIIAMILGLFSLLILTILWISFGAHLVAGKFTYDVCVDVQILIDEQNYNSTSQSSSVFKTGALANLWECNDNENLVQLQQLVNRSIYEVADGACKLRSEVCYDATTGNGDPNWICSSSPACGYSTLTTVTDKNHMTILDNGFPRSLADCAVNCSSQVYRNASSSIITVVTAFNNYTGIYFNDILPIINCQFAVDVLVQIQDPLCNTLFDALWGVALTNAIVAVFYIPFIVAMIMGFKRFQRLNNAIV